MSIYTLIKTALTALNSNASLHMHQDSREESETQNYESEVIVINTNFSGTVTKSKSGELINNTIYNVEFKDVDEWDSHDYNEETSADESTFDIIERMQLLANSVFVSILNNEDNYFAMDKQISWNFTPLWRVNSNTMSGVRAKITLPQIDSVKCNFS